MSRRVRLSLAFATVNLLSAQTKSSTSDDLIVPGVRVGPVSRTSTERSLRESLGRAAVKEDVEVGEGMTEPGLVIYKSDPTRRLDVIWNDEIPPHPATIFICRDAPDGPCRWHTLSGIGMGTTLKELESRNGKPFEMVGWGTDVGGNVTSFEGGKLERELRNFGVLGLTLVPRTNKEGDYVPKLTVEELDAVEGEKFILSSHPSLQKLNPYAAGMSLEFPRDVREK